jgi:hypothetical protein
MTERSRDPAIDPRVEESLHSDRIEWSDRYAPEPLVGERSVQLRRVRQARADAHRRDDLHRDIAQSSEGERKGLRRRGVDPLDVIDCQEDPCRPRKMLDRLEDGRTDGSTIRPNPPRLGSEQGHIDRASLGWWQPIGDLVEDLAEEIAQRREGELRFLLGRRCRKHTPSRAMSEVNSL